MMKRSLQAQSAVDAAAADAEAQAKQAKSWFGGQAKTARESGVGDVACIRVDAGLIAGWLHRTHVDMDDGGAWHVCDAEKRNGHN